MKKLRIYNVIKIIRNLIFIPFFGVFSYLIPKKKNLILLGSAFGEEFVGNTKYFYLYMFKRKKIDFEYYWITRNKKILNELLNNKMPVIYLYSFNGLWKILRSNYLLIEQSSQGITGVNFLLGRFKFFNFWHGTPLKKIMYDDKFIKGFKYLIIRKKEWNIYKYILAKSSDMVRDMKSAFRNKNIINLGYPRDDIFLNKNLQWRDYKKLLNIKNKKTYFYLPTYRDKNIINEPFSDIFLKKLNKYFKENNIVLLVKKHRDDGLIKINKNLSNIKDVSGVVDDVQDLLIDIDLLITDYSSVMFDFVLSDKPVILYSYDYNNYIKSYREMYYDYYEEMVGPFAQNESELFHLILTQKEWHNNVKYKKKYMKFKDRFNFFQDGFSSERIYIFLLNNL